MVISGDYRGQEQNTRTAVASDFREDEVGLMVVSLWFGYPPRDGAGQMINIPGVGLFNTLLGLGCPCSRQ